MRLASERLGESLFIPWPMTKIAALVRDRNNLVERRT
jgi:hypothetical protein